jgi:hypothetical protein
MMAAEQADSGLERLKAGAQGVDVCLADAAVDIA